MHACVLCGAVPKRGKKKLELQMFVGAEIEPGWSHCSLTPSHLFSPLSASLVVPITGVMSLYVPKTMPAIFESIVGRKISSQWDQAASQSTNSLDFFCYFLVLYWDADTDFKWERLQSFCSFQILYCLWRCAVLCLYLLLFNLYQVSFGW